MIVAGGTYRERCVTPEVDLLFGSGGRAALALRDLEPVAFQTFHPDREDIEVNFGPNVIVHSSPVEISFDYLHPLGTPRITPFPIPDLGTRSIDAERVIRFGCLEGNFRIRASMAVYDPQSGGTPRPFGENGSRADRLAVVLNAAEARQLSGEVDLTRAAIELLAMDDAEAVVIKNGPAGAVVAERGGRIGSVPAYRTKAIFKIGSGDVFTATFAHYWATQGLGPCESADFASRQVAAYVASRRLPCPVATTQLEPVCGGLSGLIVGIAVDDRQVRTRWLAHEARSALLGLGAADAVYVPGVPAHILFAMPSSADGPAMRAVKRAVAEGQRCVIFADGREAAAAASMLGVEAIADFTAALYAVSWISDEGPAFLWRH